MPLFEKISRLPGVKRVAPLRVVRVEIIVADDPPEMLEAIYQEEERLIDEHPEILFDLDIVKEDR